MENLELCIKLPGPSIVDYVSILGNPFLVEMVLKVVVVPATTLDQGFLHRILLEKNLLIKRAPISRIDLRLRAELYFHP